MEKVGNLLANTDMTLDAMAPQVGFSSNAALNRAVKAYFGQLPGQLRKLLRESLPDNRPNRE